MNKLTIFYLPNCPYCRIAFDLINKYQATHDTQVEIEYIDESKNMELANQFDYQLVPTFYFGNTKLHEGVTNMKDIERIFAEFK